MAKKSAHAAAGTQAPALPDRAPDLRKRLLAWYRENRRDLPWRKTQDAYAVWLSEVMLQQTRVETVIPYYARFLRAYPTVHALAEAPEGDVLALWSGLGYYRRARMLHAGARHVAEAHAGVFPREAAELRTIPGIGPYTAGAVSSIAYGRPAPLVDGNVARVLARLFAVEEDVRTPKGLSRVWSIAGALVDPTSPGDFNQALMELGAMVCTPRSPKCETCPVRGACDAFAQGRAAELPRLKAKAKPKPEAQVVVVATRGDRVVLLRRKADLRFGGLWEPPGAIGDGDLALASLEALVGASLGDVQDVGRVVHVLSHRRLDVRVCTATVKRAPASAVAAEEYDARALVSPADFDQYGLSTLARKILARAKIG